MLAHIMLVNGFWYLIILKFEFLKRNA